MKYLFFEGDKTLILFLHGWGADKSSFLWVRPYFNQHSLAFIDFAGFGESEPPERAYSVSDYTLEIKEFLDGFEFERLVIVGHSFGGRVAMMFAAKYQNEYKDLKIVLVDAAGLKPKRSIKYHFKVSLYKFCKKREAKFEFCKKMTQKLGSSDYKNTSGVMRKTFVNVVNENLEQYAKMITCGTCIIWGRRDKDTKPYMAKKLNKFIRGSKLVFLEDAGHFSFLDKPREFLEFLDTFIKN